MIYIYHVTYDEDGELFNEGQAPIAIKNPIYKTVGEWIAARVSVGWTATSENQVAKVDRQGFLDVVTYLEKGESQ